MTVSLNQQIDEIDRELAQRAQVYPQLIASRRLRESIADFQVARLEAVKKTLLWLAENEIEIREIMAARRQATAEPSSAQTE